jgi:hypothetical protein
MNTHFQLQHIRRFHHRAQIGLLVSTLTIVDKIAKAVQWLITPY